MFSENFKSLQFLIFELQQRNFCLKLNYLSIPVFKLLFVFQIILKSFTFDSPNYQLD